MAGRRERRRSWCPAERTLPEPRRHVRPVPTRRDPCQCATMLSQQRTSRREPPYAPAQPEAEAALIDRIGPTLEDRSRAWLAAHPTPPEDEQDRICWQAVTNYVTLLDDIRAEAAKLDELPADPAEGGGHDRLSMRHGFAVADMFSEKFNANPFPMIVCAGCGGERIDLYHDATLPEDFPKGWEVWHGTMWVGKISLFDPRVISSGLPPPK
jgi:hypothetical protein